MSREYFQDIKLHQVYRSRNYPLTENEVIDFAKLWDPQPYHIDLDFAKSTRFGGLFASGIHLIAITTKLAHEKRPWPFFVAGMGLDKFKWLAPGRPGDVLVFEMEVISKRGSRSDKNTGIVRYAFKLFNQHNETLLTYVASGLVMKR